MDRLEGDKPAQIWKNIIKVMLKKFNMFLQEVRGGRCGPEDTTLIFDKGNNSPANFEMIDSMGLNFVGSVKLGEHKELAQISNGDDRFRSCEAAGLDGTKAFLGCEGAGCRCV